MYIVLRNLRVNGKPYRAGELLQSGEQFVDYEELLQKKYLLAIEEPKPTAQTAKPPVKPKQPKPKVTPTNKPTTTMKKVEEETLVEEKEVLATETLITQVQPSTNLSQGETN